MTDAPVTQPAEALLFTEPDDPEHAWEVTSDTDAEWALERIATHQAEVDRINANAAEAIDRIRSKAEHDAAQSQRRIDHLTSLLVAYRRQLEEADPTLPKTYRLPSGDLKRRQKPTKVTIADEDAFVAWASEGHLDLLTLRPSVTAIKKACEVTDDGSAITEDGEVLPGVTIGRDPDAYSVQIASGGAS